jgi:uncharacterized membrane protein YhhN
MTTIAFLLLGCALVAAVVDWIAVIDSDHRLELLCKPLAIVGLIGVALALEPDNDSVRTWFVAALIFSLAGDVFLMIRRWDLFVLGLGAFLVAHLAYVLGFLIGGVDALRTVGGLVVAGAAVGTVGLRIVKAVHERQPELALPVVTYMGVISLMLVVAIGSGSGAALLGGLLFYISDALIGWSRFVKDFKLAPLAIIVTYHVAQVALVSSLI